MRPSASNSAVLKSPASVITGDPDERIIAIAISSTIASRRIRMTSRVTGSVVMTVMLDPLTAGRR